MLRADTQVRRGLPCQGSTGSAHRNGSLQKIEKAKYAKQLKQLNSVGSFGEFAFIMFALSVFFVALDEDTGWGDTSSNAKTPH